MPNGKDVALLRLYDISFQLPWIKYMQNYLSNLYKKLSGKMKLGLQRCETLMEELDHPENSFPSIHIAGTNGKGTVTVVAAALLEALGLKTGRFTSPHL
ncbi:MAG: hypothetical protein KAU44_01580, partial [Candidatus Marinimicrobia bacterium]|nr:hypothetical protein [Candidatus Neomarinimicrobiota bacterium]